MTAAAGHPSHPAPHRDRVSPLRLWTSLLLPPAAYFLLLTLDTVLASLACFPGDVPLQAPRLHVAPIVLSADAVVLLVTLACGIFAWTNWRRTAHEGTGGGHHLMESGDGRTRFMAMAGVLTSGILFLTTAYTLASHWSVAWCGT